MIYNLINYLKVQLPTLDFVANGFSVKSPSESITVIQTGGTVEHWYVRTDVTAQILSRAEYSDKAKQNIDKVYNLLLNKFGLTLPAIVVNGKVYPEVILWQVSPIQYPGYIGADEENLEKWSYNIKATIQ